jgi:hypothetical protein
MNFSDSSSESNFEDVFHAKDIVIDDSDGQAKSERYEEESREEHAGDDKMT